MVDPTQPAQTWEMSNVHWDPSWAGRGFGSIQVDLHLEWHLSFSGACIRLWWMLEKNEFFTRFFIFFILFYNYQLRDFILKLIIIKKIINNNKRDIKKWENILIKRNQVHTIKNNWNSDLWAWISRAWTKFMRHVVSFIFEFCCIFNFLYKIFQLIFYIK